MAAAGTYHQYNESLIDCNIVRVQLSMGQGADIVLSLGGDQLHNNLADHKNI